MILHYVESQIPCSCFFVNRVRAIVYVHPHTTTNSHVHNHTKHTMHQWTTAQSKYSNPIILSLPPILMSIDCCNGNTQPTPMNPINPKQSNPMMAIHHNINNIAFPVRFTQSSAAPIDAATIHITPTCHHIKSIPYLYAYDIV